MKKIMSFCLVAAMLLLALIGCGRNDQPANATTEGSAAESAGETVVSEEITVAGDKLEAEYPNSVKGVTFGNAECVILTRDQGYLEEFVGVEGVEASFLDSTVYYRNLEVEDELDICLTQITRPQTELTVFVRQDSLAEEETFHLVGNYAYAHPQLATEGLLYNLNRLPYINLNYPWYSQKFINAAMYDSKLYMVACDWGYTSHEKTWGTVTNLNMLKKNGITDDLVEVALDGGWTMEYLKSLVKNAWRDDDGNGEEDDTDTYGLLVSRGGGPVEQIMFGLGYRLTAQNTNGDLTPIMNSQTNVDLFDYAYELYHNTDGVHYSEQYFLNMPISDSFLNQKTIFAFQPVEIIRKAVAASNFDYVLLPMPKYNEEQKEYYSFVGDGYSQVSVCKKVSDPNMVGAVLETMNRRSYLKLRPVLFETLYENRYSNTAEEAELFTVVIDSGAFDFIAIHAAVLEHPIFKVRDALGSASNTYASTMKSYNTQLGVRLSILLKKYSQLTDKEG